MVGNFIPSFIQNNATMSQDNITKLRKFVAPEFIFGEGAILQAGSYAERFQVQKALLVTDEGVENEGWCNIVIQNLNEYGIRYHLFDKITPNPKDHEVIEGADIYRQNSCNAIIAVGGGSVIDCAKGIGIVVSNNKHITHFEGVDQVPVPIPPLICIPTTGGTSADVSQFAIINNTVEKVKMAIISKAMVPDIALIDPATLTTMDSYLTACTGVDALVHAIEAYVSNAHSPITDLHALNAIQLIHQYLQASITDPQNLHFRTQIMQASLEAGLAFSNASLGAVHAMAHSLGGYLDMPHGECNAMLLPHVINYNFDSVPERFKNIAKAFGIETQGVSNKTLKQTLLDFSLSFTKEAGITETLGTKGVSVSDLPILAQKANNDACIITNPKAINKGDIQTIYSEAL